MRKFSLLLAIAALLAFPHAILAQRSTATIRGTVADATRSSLPGALVTAKNDATGLTRTATTNDAGLYSIAELPVGLYTVQVEFAGFKTAVRTGLTLNVADDRAVDFELQPGSVSETVQVEANSQAVRTIGGDVSGVITGEQVRELPLNGRNFLQLATLMPGVSAPDFLNVKDKGLLGGSDLSVSGSGVTVEPLDGGRRQQQRRRLEPHDPRVSLGRSDRGVQDPAQQLRRGVRPVAAARRSTSSRAAARTSSTGAASTSAATTRSTRKNYFLEQAGPAEGGA